MNALELRDVTVSRGAGPVIRDVSLDVRPGAITALVGPNGAGKTSLLEAVSGVVPVSGGSISVDGTPITRLSRVARSRLGLVHIEQGRAVFPSLTVVENVRLSARSSAELDDALALFPELDERRDSPAELLSGGEQQMVVLARAFAARPAFLLIDEMSLGLAPVVFTRLLPMVQRFADQGVGILLVEQFTHLALGLAREALVVASGRVTYHGDAQALRDSPDTLHAAYLGG
ncbi:ATP-binding cassette domain-containing protein [Actinobacteria bacterium YIM 96077]|uniref:ABC transporter ATP-binding protein n=1 Tax=Phytoactinopolyspora halophila TaxID=1981511 RepID=A0A329QJL4_9ACTN|nr:ATP-binding cassette domain-containing protein [Phytoactinopolyspora halophila]AYY12531.1 ATP-binding cassette domain-containing protein [Actinobacteria bacterium YIM 96077]RAW12565.1 ABC transporter ATP-binding protein [Phytoactinopolyspora halophila]